MDTAHITEIYLERPLTMMYLSFGEWFNNALELGDKKLAHLNLRDSKLYILEKEYNKLPDLLNRLKEYNRGNSSY